MWPINSSPSYSYTNLLFILHQMFPIYAYVCWIHTEANMYSQITQGFYFFCNHCIFMFCSPNEVDSSITVSDFEFCVHTYRGNTSPYVKGRRNISLHNFHCAEATKAPLWVLWCLLETMLLLLVMSWTSLIQELWLSFKNYVFACLIYLKPNPVSAHSF